VKIGDLPEKLRPLAQAQLDAKAPRVHVATKQAAASRRRRTAAALPDPAGEVSSAPMCVVLAYAALVPDNRRATMRDGQVRHTPRYAEAKDAVRNLARLQLRRRAPFAGDVVLVGRLWKPDRRRRDTANLLKLVHDALSGVAYLDDEQIADFRYVREGIDRDRPRLELTITPAAAPGPRGTHAQED